jgi:hypothetical protein
MRKGNRLLNSFQAFFFFCLRYDKTADYINICHFQQKELLLSVLSMLPIFQTPKPIIWIYLFYYIKPRLKFTF